MFPEAETLPVILKRLYVDELDASLELVVVALNHAHFPAVRFTTVSPAVNVPQFRALVEYWRLTAGGELPAFVIDIEQLGSSAVKHNPQYSDCGTFLLANAALLAPSIERTIAAGARPATMIAASPAPALTISRRVVMA